MTLPRFGPQTCSVQRHIYGFPDRTKSSDKLIGTRQHHVFGIDRLCDPISSICMRTMKKTNNSDYVLNTETIHRLWSVPEIRRHPCPCRLLVTSGWQTSNFLGCDIRPSSRTKRSDSISVWISTTTALYKNISRNYFILAIWFFHIGAIQLGWWIQ